MFKTKTHLLSEVREMCTAKELSVFAQIVSADSLNKARIRTKGSVEKILESLLLAPKSVLESAFEECFVDDDQGYEPDKDRDPEDYESEIDDDELDEEEDD